MLEFLCYECPHCHHHRVSVEFVRDQVKMVCGLCGYVTVSWFDGQMWVSTLVEVVPTFMNLALNS